MSATNPNGRLEAFCDGVFAVAITLLVLEIKVPKLDTIHSSHDFWHAMGHLWPSFVAFILSFIVILIAWYNHHSTLKMLNKSSAGFAYANGFLLLATVLLPFSTALLGEYIQTDYAREVIFIYCLNSLMACSAWCVFFYTILNPKPLTGNASQLAKMKAGAKQTYLAFGFYSLVCASAWWFPYVALGISAFIWIFWLVIGITHKVEEGEE